MYAPSIAHRYLYNHVGILHCDLSLNNVLLTRKGDESEATGLLIDYDHSINVDLKAANQQVWQHTAGSVVNASGTRGTTMEGKQIAVAGAHPEVSLDSSERNASRIARPGTEKSGPYGEISRMVRCAHFLHFPS